jgi:AraC family transcriptional regulator, regulatory protein of adaptative response / DNA-3-methyladenine glycosylase II
MPGVHEVVLTPKGPLDWVHLAGFLGRRAIPGVESVDEDVYARGTLRVMRDGRRFVARGGKDEIGRVRALLDFDADATRIEKHLGRDPLLARSLASHRGIRVPGGWDAFEMTVRAIVGQQVSVAAARSLLGTLAATYGERRNGHVAFPTAASLAAEPIRLGMPRKRLESLRAVSAAVANGLVLKRKATLDETLRMLDDLPGVGPWTANYIAMRALDEKDAFPAGDLILRRNAGNLTEKQLIARAEQWRPWRSYAAMLLWAS